MMKRLWIVGVLIAMTLAGQCSAQEDRKPLEIRQVVSATKSDTGTVLDIQLDGGEEVRLTLETHTSAALKDHEIWLRGIAKNNGFAGFDPNERALFPATIALEVAWGREDALESEAVEIFAPPRPAGMYLRRDLSEFARLKSVLEQVVDNGHGAVFAVRAGLWIEDVRPIAEKDARRLLNFVPTQP